MKTVSLLKDDAVLLKYINGQPALVSLLYDANLLPEQCPEGSERRKAMNLMAVAFKAGKDSRTESVKG